MLSTCPVSASSRSWWIGSGKSSQIAVLLPHHQGGIKISLRRRLHHRRRHRIKEEDISKGRALISFWEEVTSNPHQTSYRQISLNQISMWQANSQWGEDNSTQPEDILHLPQISFTRTSITSTGHRYSQYKGTRERRAKCKEQVPP
jgi:hypothetical protein